MLPGMSVARDGYRQANMEVAERTQETGWSIL